jgi:hypothetical protein
MISEFKWWFTEGVWSYNKLGEKDLIEIEFNRLYEKRNGVKIGETIQPKQVNPSKQVKPLSVTKMKDLLFTGRLYHILLVHGALQLSIIDFCEQFPLEKMRGLLNFGVVSEDELIDALTRLGANIGDAKSERRRLRKMKLTESK